MNAFERYGISHGSPSHYNLYSQSQAKWGLVYLYKFRDESAAMHRGSAVEAGIVHYLRDTKRDAEAAIEEAKRVFREKTVGEITPATEKEWEVIPGMVEQGCIALAGRELPAATQSKVEHNFEGIDVVTEGYCDVTWPEKGLEIKSTNRMPTGISWAHARQAAFYSFCKKRPFEVLYVSRSKFQLIPLEDTDVFVRSLEWTAHAIQNLLNAFPDRESIMRVLPAPDYDHPYLWSSEAARQAAEQIWR